MVALLSVALAAIAVAPGAWRSRLRLPVAMDVDDLVLGVTAVGAAVALGLAPHTALLGASLAIGGLVALRVSRRATALRRQRAALPAVADGLAAAVRAGLPLPDALAAVAAGQEREVADALRGAATLLRLGRPLADATRLLDETFGPPALLVRETLRAFHRRGGGVARALDRAARLARAEAELQDEIHALTAQGRASALVLALLAPCGLLFFVVANPAGLRAFLTESRGQLLLSVALLLEGVGALWLWRLVRG